MIKITATITWKMGIFLLVLMLAFHFILFYFILFYFIFLTFFQIYLGEN